MCGAAPYGKLRDILLSLVEAVCFQLTGGIYTLDCAHLTYNSAKTVVN